LKGRRFVLYFYPKNDTPGCTREACDFRDNLARLRKEGVEVYGVSKDPVKVDGHVDKVLSHLRGKTESKKAK